ncbi:hypothetical protein HN51_021557, partial [Arachis hypogaea]
MTRRVTLILCILCILVFLVQFLHSKHSQNHMLRLKNGVKSVTAEKQMLLKEVKLSKARRKHAEQESERWKAVSEGKHKRHSLKSMLVNLSSRMDVFPVARVGQHSSTGSSQIAKESDSFPHFADKYLPQRTEGL